MHLSPFFHNLRSAYVAELNDLSHESDGALVLQQRLAQRRGELEFLVHMLELSPEMVAVVFHKAFSFDIPMAMAQTLGSEPEDLPEWDVLANAVTVAPWAHGMVRTVRAQAAGDWFMVVAAACEYMLDMPDTTSAGTVDHDNADGESNHDADPADGGNHLSADDDTRGDPQTREEAGADWLAEHGFDRKD
ncbi:MAG: hypothetical protein ABI434_09825 [Burkholderiaceae bacterium]